MSKQTKQGHTACEQCGGKTRLIDGGKTRICDSCSYETPEQGHTPGPWVRQGTLIHGPDKGIHIGSLIAEVFDNGPNAALIATAPTMYAFIQEEYAKGHISKKGAEEIFDKVEGRQ